MTTKLDMDRYGTECNVDDRYVMACGATGKITRLNHPRSDVEITHRADGTPVCRYADNQDVRHGDRFARPDGEQSTVQSRYPICKHESGTQWSECTLVSRADAPKKQRVILGKDKHGNDVRDGDTVIHCSAGITYIVDNIERLPGWSVSAVSKHNYFFVSKDRRMSSWPEDTELVQAVTTTTSGLSIAALGHSHSVPSVTVNGQPVPIKSAGVGDYRLVHDFAPILKSGITPTATVRIAGVDASKPYRSAQERYALFNETMSVVVGKEPTFSVVTDCCNPGGLVEEFVAWIRAPLVPEQSFQIEGHRETEFGIWAASCVDTVRRMVTAAAGKKAMAGK